MKKILTFALAAVLVLGLLAGCKPTEEQVNEDGLPYRKLVVMYPFISGEQRDTNLVLAEVNKYLKEKINAEIQLEGIGFGAHAQKWPLMLQTNEQIDVLWQKGNDIVQNVPRKAYLALDDLLDKYGKDVKACFTPDVLEGIKMEGKIYALPAYKELAMNACLYYDIEIAERNGIDYANIATFADLDKALEKIKANEEQIPLWIARGTYLPTGSLKAEGEDMLRYEDVQGSLIVGTGGQPLLVLDTQTDKIIMRYQSPYQVEKYKYARDWYLKGYINQDAATADGDTRTFTAWISGGSGKPGSAELATATSGTPYGGGVATPIIMSGNSLTGSMINIPSSSVDPERAMMLINLLYSDEYLINLLQFGIEGKHYIKNADGTMAMLEGDKLRGDSGYYPATEWVIGNQFINYLYETESPTKAQDYLDYNAAATMAKSTGFIFNSENVKTENAALSTILDEYMRLIDCGAVDPEPALAEMTNKMNAVGAEKVLAEAQKQYDEWKAAK